MRIVHISLMHLLRATFGSIGEDSIAMHNKSEMSKLVGYLPVGGGQGKSSCNFFTISKF